MLVYKYETTERISTRRRRKERKERKERKRREPKLDATSKGREVRRREEDDEEVEKYQSRVLRDDGQ